jgi:hypothetical protein
MRKSISSIRMLPALFGISTVIAIGLSASGANSQPAPAVTPAPAPAPAPAQVFEYAVKFVCGRAVATHSIPPPVAPGFYYTDINVHSPNGGTVDFRKKFAVALPNQKAGPISQFFTATLKPDEAFSVECAEITKKLNLPPASFVTGFAVFQIGAPRELDIVAVYTTAAAQTGTIVTMHMERIPKRP